MNYQEKALGHFKTICIHKYYVFQNCCKAGIPMRGLLHDLSKFTPVEFLESTKYFQGNRSPINACKDANGVSKAWLHHKGRNPHHYEYWQDDFDHGGMPLKMPFICALELVCDYLAAGQAYNKEKFTYSQEYEWWENKCRNPVAMHPQTRRFVDLMLLTMKEENSNDVLEIGRARRVFTLAEFHAIHESCRKGRNNNEDKL